MPNDQRFTLRDDRLEQWREVYAQSYPQHRLSYNQWIGAMVAAGIKHHYQEEKIES